MGESHVAGKKYWIISQVVEVITSKSNEFITSGQTPRVINSLLLQVITSTTSDNIHYFLPAAWE